MTLVTEVEKSIEHEAYCSTIIKRYMTRILSLRGMIKRR